MEMQDYKLKITFSGFGTKKEVLKQFKKKGRKLIIENSEFVGDKENEHHSGVYEEIFESDDLNEYMKNYIKENDCQGECFGIYKPRGTVELFTEENLN